LASTNNYPGLARGPLDHQSSSVINMVAAGAIQMGSAVILSVTGTAELLPRATLAPVTDTGKAYGVAVGGDLDGTYNDGSSSTDDADEATNAAGQGVVVVTQGRCLARVNGAYSNAAGAQTGIAVAAGDKLTLSTYDAGALMVFNELSDVDEWIIATALQAVDSGDTDMIAIDIQREGLWET